MNESRRLEIAKLAQAESRARQHFEALGMTNTTPLTAEQRVELDAQYAVAWADWQEFRIKLRDAIGPMALRGQMTFPG